VRDLKKEICETVLPFVQKPGRYIGGELNAVIKDPAAVSGRLLLAFPDVYEIGMSHFGCKILYELVNGDPRFCAERAFSPWPDMEKLMRERGIPLYSLENFSPAGTFDIVGFSLQYELSYTNVLNMLDLSGIPLYAREREGGRWPLIVAGGPSVFNPEPMADFIDAFFIGEAEKTLLQFMELVSARRKTTPARDILAEASRTIDGIYVPSLYGTAPNKSGYGVVAVPERRTVSFPVEKSVIEDLNAYPSPTRQIVPFINIVHDRAGIEIMRGCARGCRFCQAGSVYRPRRYRERARLVREAQEAIKNTGYQEISLLSLSTGDYPEIQGLVEDLVAVFDKRKVSLSIPSLRVDSFSVEVAKKIKEIKKTGFTFACEAGTERLLEVIRKEISFSDLYGAVESAYRSGWKLIKLYFMIGLPGETYDDIDKIAGIIYKVSEIKKAVDGIPGNVNVTVSSFVPKPHTPFQWVRMNSMEELKDKQLYLKKKIHGKRFHVKFHEVRKNVIEAVFSRGDRRLAAVVHAAWQKGARFDDWDEYFNYDLWMGAFRDAAVDHNRYLEEYDPHDRLPWDIVSTGVSDEALKNEYRKALELINDTKPATSNQ
jgi:radical SAM family uncharacterized protein